MITNSFALSRRLGAGIGYGDTNWGINASVFGDELTRNLAEGSGLGARGFWAPINDKGNILLHVHPSVSQVSTVNKDVDLGTSGTLRLPLAASSTSELDSIVRGQNGRVVAIGS